MRRLRHLTWPARVALVLALALAIGCFAPWFSVKPDPHAPAALNAGAPIVVFLLAAFAALALAQAKALWSGALSAGVLLLWAAWIVGGVIDMGRLRYGGDVTMLASGLLWIARLGAVAAMACGLEILARIYAAERKARPD